jgi:SAM-dependent methyltransferase
MLVQSAESHYQGEAGRRYQENKRGIPDSALPWVTRLRAEKFLAYISEKDVVLEYGVGFGWNLAALPCKRKIGFDVADFLEPAVRALGIEFVTETKSLPDGCANVLICHHTLEHVPDPPAVLAEIRRLLVPGGRLLLFVPLEQESKYHQYNPDEPNHHLYSWNTQTLGNLVKEMGFQIAGAGTGEYGYARFAAALAAKLGIGERGFRLARRFLLTVKPIREVRIVAIKPTTT